MEDTANKNTDKTKNNKNNEPEYEIKPINLNLLSEEDLHPSENK